MKPSRISKVVEAPRDTAIYRFGHSKSSFSLAVLVRGLKSIDQSENGNTAAKRTAHEYEFELPVETHFRLCIKIQCKQDKIPYREV